MDEEAEEVPRWRRLGELGFEAGLREGGFSDNAIAAIAKYVPWSGDRIVGLFRNDEMVEILASVENGRAILLAVLGRGDTTLKSLCLRRHGCPTDQLHPKEAAALCANLSTNTNLKELDASLQTIFCSPKGCTVLGKMLKTNVTLQRLHLEFVGIGSEEVRCLMDGLEGNKTLEALNLRWNPLWDEGITYVAEVLKRNKTLKFLDVSHTQSSFEGAKHVASLLEHSATLETLKFSGNKIGKEGMRVLLQPLSRGLAGEPVTGNSDGQRNNTLKALELESMDLENFSRESLAWMIQTNKTLSRLDIGPNPLLPEDWVEHIFPSLKKNETLTELSLFGCKGLAGGAVHDSLIDLLQFSNTGLGQIHLDSSGMQSSQGQVDEELRMNREYRSRLRHQTTVPATSSRLVLCGFESAGKSTIRKTMESIVQGSLCAQPCIGGWRKLVELFGTNGHNELADRTRGFDVVILKDQPFRTSVWDFGGQREYYTLHDYLFPDIHNSCFLYVCSPRYGPDRHNPEGRVKKQCTMRDECEYWMRFLASNSKPRRGVDGPGRELLQVRFVLTNKDTLSSSRLDVAKQRADRVVVQLKKVFRDVIDLCETVAVVNAESRKDVARLITLTNASLKEVLSRRTEYGICEEVRTLLTGWSAKNQSKPVLSLQDFYALCEGLVNPEVPKPRPKEDWDAALAYLNDLGDIIHPKGSGFVVANPRWLGVGLFGVLIDAFRRDEVVRRPEGSCCTTLFNRGTEAMKLEHDDGFVHRDSLLDLLGHSLQSMHLKQNVPSEMVIELMVKLEIGFEKEPGNAQSSLFIPALFHDDEQRAAKGTRPLEWLLERKGPFIYLGRRLQCQNETTTFLTPGFFPRLQVHLCNYIHQKAWTGQGGFAVDRNLICFAEDGVEVCLEYSCNSDYFVDILVRSSKPYAVALNFIEEHVVRRVLQFCASPQGCQGVVLVEAVIRPACVRNLHVCIDRKAHSVLVSTLESHLEAGYGYRHTWSDAIEDELLEDFALDLLEGEGSYMSFLTANQVDLSREGSGANRVDLAREGSGSIAHNLTSPYEDTPSIQDQLPRLFYPAIEDVGMLRSVETRMNLARVMPIRLHLLCEAKAGPHSVEGQPGRLMKLNWRAGGNNLPIIKYAVVLLWAGVRVGTRIAGGAGVLPSEDDRVEKLLDVPTMSVTVEKLFQIVRHGKSIGQVPERDILKVLKKYLTLDPSTPWLKGFLDLQDDDKFWRDFGLQKAEYTDSAHRHDIAWLCEHHFASGLRQSTLRPAPQ